MFNDIDVDCVIKKISLFYFCNGRGTNNVSKKYSKKSDDMAFHLSIIFPHPYRFWKYDSGYVKNESVHDHSVIKVDDTYYVFGSHLAAAKSKDLMNWTKVADGVNVNNPLFENVVEELKETFDWAE